MDVKEFTNSIMEKITNKQSVDLSTKQTVKHIGQPDEPAMEDEFEIRDYIGGLAAFIVECNTPLTISIQGSWGTGKTSIMNLVNNELKKNNENGETVIPIWFNTWQFSQFNMSEQLPISLINSLINKLDVKDSAINDKAKKVLKGLRYCYLVGKAATIAALELSGAGNTADMANKSLDAAETAISELSRSDPSVSIENLKKTFTDCIAKKLEEKNIDKEKGRVVIFIDDLDRLNPGKAVELLEVLKLFLDCKNCVFVLAIDYDVVCRGVDIKYGTLSDDKTASMEKGRSFFDKIIQVPFKMPVARYKIEKYVSSCFNQIGIEFTDNELNTYIELIQHSVGTNPRSMKRLFNAFQLLLKIVEKSYMEKNQDNQALNINVRKTENQQLLFAILCLQHCSEKIYSFIIRNLKKLDAEIFKSIVDVDLAAFQNNTEAKEIDPDELTEDDFQAARPFMAKLRKAIDFDKNDVIDEAEFKRFKDIIDFTAITNTTEIEQPQTVKRGKQIVDNYEELEIPWNSTDEVKKIIEVIYRIGEDIDLQFIRANNSDDCIRGKINGKTIIDVYGRSCGYSMAISAPKEDVLRDEEKYPEVLQMMREMKISPTMKSYPRTVSILVDRHNNLEQREEKLIEFGRKIREIWLEQHS